MSSFVCLFLTSNLREVRTSSSQSAVVNQPECLHYRILYWVKADYSSWGRPISHNLFLSFQSSCVTPTSATGPKPCAAAAALEIKLKTQNVSRHTCRHGGKESDLIRRSKYSVTEIWCHNYTHTWMRVGMQKNRWDYLEAAEPCVMGTCSSCESEKDVLWLCVIFWSCFSGPFWCFCIIFKCGVDKWALPSPLMVSRDVVVLWQDTECIVVCGNARDYDHDIFHCHDAQPCFLGFFLDVL